MLCLGAPLNTSEGAVGDLAEAEGCSSGLAFRGVSVVSALVVLAPQPPSQPLRSVGRAAAEGGVLAEVRVHATAEAGVPRGAC